jgi:glycosyltransferase involved in cell wall biosynthesis
MKKILYFVPTFSNLSETFILREIESLEQRGNLDIHVISLKEGTARIPDSLIYKVSYFKVSFADLLPAIGFGFKNFKQIYKVFKKFLKESEDGLKLKLKNFAKGVLYAYKLSPFEYDQIHIHFLSDISTIISISALINKKSFSISGHARDIFVEASSINFKVKNSKFITVCNTKAFLKCVELSGGKGRKNLIMSFHGVDNSKYQYSLRKFTSTGNLNVLTDARFTEKKGLIPLSKAVISLIKDYNFNINFTIVGLAVTDEQFKHLEEIKKLFKDAHIYERLSVPGHGKGVQQEEVIEIYKNAQIFIYAGVDTRSGDSDGVPNGLLQAAYSGLPVITTLSGSIADLFNERNSYIIKQASFEDIIEKFNFLMLDKVRADKSEKLKKDVSENFDLIKNITYLESQLLK